MLTSAVTGGYDDGYKSSLCFWGSRPGRLVRLLGQYVSSFRGLLVLDAGCGEGKNAYWLAERGANVMALDVSALALSNAVRMKNDGLDIRFRRTDVTNFTVSGPTFHITIAYGLLHCLTGPDQVEAVCNTLRAATLPGGFVVVCAINNRRPANRRAHPQLSPCLLPHDFYVEQFCHDDILYNTDEDLMERHPNNGILHTHAMTRLLIKRSTHGK